MVRKSDGVESSRTMQNKVVSFPKIQKPQNTSKYSIQMAGFFHTRH